MKTRLYDHIDLRVKDRARAQQFYAQVLPALGFTTENSDDEWGTFYAPGEGKPPFFGFTEDPGHRPNGTRISDRKVLPALGFTTENSDDEWGTFYAPGEGKPPFFGFTEDPGHRPNGTRI